jgi:hypothetical protein
MAKKPTCEELEQRVKQSKIISFDSSTLLIYFSNSVTFLHYSFIKIVRGLPDRPFSPDREKEVYN